MLGECANWRLPGRYVLWPNGADLAPTPSTPAGPRPGWEVKPKPLTTRPRR